MNGAIPTLLRIDSSIRDGASVSRAVANTFEAAWETAHPGGPISKRELGLTPLPYLTELEHAAMFIPVEHRGPEHIASQARAAVLADELFAADVILLTAPLYNLGIPACLKTYLDHVFTDIRLFPGFGITKPLTGRTVVVVSARGGAYGPGMPLEGWDHEAPYLRRQLVDILGCDVEEVVIDLTMAAVNPKLAHLTGVADASLADAHVRAAQLGRGLAGAIAS
jgi:FMN-dependent NADH-azoreductase